MHCIFFLLRTSYFLLLMVVSLDLVLGPEIFVQWLH